MAENSKIEWTHHTFNPWRGCTKVSAGCENCYAEKMSGRNPSVLGEWGKHGTRIVASEAMWREPLKWDKKAAEAGERHRVFCASLADVFEGPETMPEASWAAVSYARERLGALIDDTPNLDWLLLTKRPENVLKYGLLGHRWSTDRIPENVWIGTSVEDQKTADERVPELLKIPAKVRFLSMEPLLGPVDLSWLKATLRRSNAVNALSGQIFDAGERDENGHWMYDGAVSECSHIDWVIVGGESGAKARPTHPDWVRSIRDQCVEAGVAFHFKQWGHWVDPDNLQALRNVRSPGYHDWPDGIRMFEIGKKQAGRILDGRTWDQFPEVK